MLAGIPTIVYGPFALLTVGPALVSLFGENGTLFGLNWMQGGTAVMTAGLNKGIMIIPFMSSLSDDIINAKFRSPCAMVRWVLVRPTSKPSRRSSSPQPFRALLARSCCLHPVRSARP